LYSFMFYIFMLYSFMFYSFMLHSFMFTKFHPGDQMKRNEMGWTCCIFRGEERCIEGFGRRNWGKENTLMIQ
jgi:hypothetical protein